MNSRNPDEIPTEIHVKNENNNDKYKNVQETIREQREFTESKFDIFLYFNKSLVIYEGLMQFLIPKYKYDKTIS